MKNIFTYPLNSATHYIDPNYIGDDTAGFQRRVNDFIDGNISSWLGDSPIDDVNQLMENFSKYINYYDDVTYSAYPNIGWIYFEWYPQITATMGSGAVNITYREPVLTASGASGKFTTDRPHRLTSGDQVTFRYPDFFPTPIITTQTVEYVVDDYNFQIADEFSFDDRSGFMVREGSNTRVYLDYYQKTNPGKIWMVSDVITGVTGTANQRGVDFYTDPYDTTTIDGELAAREYLIYTDSGLTTPATLTEVLTTDYMETHSEYYYTFPNEFITVTLTDIPASWFSNTEVADAVQRWDDFDRGGIPVRLFMQSGSSTFDYTSPVSGTQAIESNINYSQLFWMTAGSVPDTYSIWCDRAATSAADFSMGDATNSRDLYLKIYVLKNTESTWIPNLATSASGLTYEPKYWNTSLDQPYYRVETATAWVSGNRQFRYLDSGGSLVTGSELGDYYYTPGSDILAWNTTAQTPEIPVFNFSLDANGRLESIDVVDGGVILTDDERLIIPAPLPDQYVPPAPTPVQIAAAEDNFDTQSAWDSTSGDSDKYWPDHIAPSRAEIVLTQPSVTNFSQGGDKYVRSSGYSKWQLEVQYPPLTLDQFRLFQATALKARGQAIPFYFKLFYTGTGTPNGILWSDFSSSASTSQPYVIDYDLADRTLTLAGFDSNESTVVQEGELLIAPNLKKNGDINTVLNTVDANVYGEAKIKLAEGWKYTPGQLQTVYKNPYWIVVTLNSDEFRYTIDTSERVNLTVKFDLDYYK